MRSSCSGVVVGMYDLRERVPTTATFTGRLHLILKAGDRTRTGDIQLGKLTFYH